MVYPPLSGQQKISATWRVAFPPHTGREEQVNILCNTLASVYARHKKHPSMANFRLFPLQLARVVTNSSIFSSLRILHVGSAVFTPSARMEGFPHFMSATFPRRVFQYLIFAKGYELHSRGFCDSKTRLKVSSYTNAAFTEVRGWPKQKKGRKPK